MWVRIFCDVVFVLLCTFQYFKSSGAFEYSYHNIHGQNLYQHNHQQALPAAVPVAIPELSVQTTNGQTNTRLYNNFENGFGNGPLPLQAQVQPLQTINYQNHRQEGGQGFPAAHDHPQERLGKLEVIKILLAIFPFLLPIIFVPMLLVVIGVLLIPIVRLISFNRPADDFPRSISDSVFTNDSTKRILDSVSSSKYK